MSQFVVAQGASRRKGFRRRAVATTYELSPFVLVFVLVGFICVTSLFYLMNFNKVSMKGYVIKRLEVERRKLQTEHEQKNMELSEITSLVKIRENSVVQGMVKPRNIVYMRGDTAVAVAK